MWYQKHQHDSGYYIDENNNRYIVGQCQRAHTPYGPNVGYSRFESWEDMAMCWDLNGPEPYVLPEATQTRLGGIKAGRTVTVAGDGLLECVPAGTDTPGVVTVGDTLEISPQGVLNYRLPTASAERFGAVMIGANLEFAPDGRLTTHPPYALPEATATTLGGIRVGHNLTLTAGKLSTAANVMLTNYPAPTTVTGAYFFTAPVGVARALDPGDAVNLGQVTDMVVPIVEDLENLRAWDTIMYFMMEDSRTTFERRLTEMALEQTRMLEVIEYVHTEVAALQDAYTALGTEVVLIRDEIKTLKTNVATFEPVLKSLGTQMTALTDELSLEKSIDMATEQLCLGVYAMKPFTGYSKKITLSYAASKHIQERFVGWHDGTNDAGAFVKSVYIPIHEFNPQHVLNFYFYTGDDPACMPKDKNYKPFVSFPGWMSIRLTPAARSTDGSNQVDLRCLPLEDTGASFSSSVNPEVDLSDLRGLLVSFPGDPGSRTELDGILGPQSGIREGSRYRLAAINSSPLAASGLLYMYLSSVAEPKSINSGSCRLGLARIALDPGQTHSQMLI